jgi:hypothetical protein
MYFRFPSWSLYGNPLYFLPWRTCWANCAAEIFPILAKNAEASIRPRALKTSAESMMA